LKLATPRRKAWDDPTAVAQRRADETVWRRHFGENAPWALRRIGQTLDHWCLRRIEVCEEFDRARDIRFALRRMPLWVRVVLWWEDRVQSHAAMERRLRSAFVRLREHNEADAKEYQQGYERGYAAGLEARHDEAQAAARAAAARGAS
jgi:hypothetical protein